MAKYRYKRIQQAINKTSIDDFLNKKSSDGYKIIAYYEKEIDKDKVIITVLFEKTKTLL